MELVDRGLHVVGIQASRVDRRPVARERHAAVEGLARIDEVEQPLEAHAVVGHARGRQLGSGGSLEVVGERVEPVDVDIGPRREQRARRVDDVIGGEQPERREPGSGAGHQHVLHAERGRLRGRVHGTHPAERDEVEPARVGAREREDPPDRVGHVRVDQRDDRGRGGLDVEAALSTFNGCTDLCERAPRRVVVEAQTTTPERAGVEPAEHEIGVGDGRPGTAAPVANGARLRSGRLGADVQDAVVDARSSRRRRRSTRCRPSAARCSSGGASSSRCAARGARRG